MVRERVGLSAPVGVLLSAMVYGVSKKEYRIKLSVSKLDNINKEKKSWRMEKILTPKIKDLTAFLADVV